MASLEFVQFSEELNLFSDIYKFYLSLIERSEAIKLWVCAQ